MAAALLQPLYLSILKMFTNKCRQIVFSRLKTGGRARARAQQGGAQGSIDRETVSACAYGCMGSMDFQEQQKELCQLSSFINNQERWIDSVLGRLGWTKDGLRSHVRVCTMSSMISDDLYPSSRWRNAPTTQTITSLSPHLRHTR